MHVEELAAYIEQYADEIPVRESVNGKREDFALSELPVKLAIRHAMRLLIRGDIPHRNLRRGDGTNGDKYTVCKQEEWPSGTKLLPMCQPGSLRRAKRILHELRATQSPEDVYVISPPPGMESQGGAA